MNLDLTWFHDHLTDDLLPRWHRSAVNPDGLFHTNLARDWARNDMPCTTLVGQCRPIYNFAVGYEVTGLPEYREAARNGVKWLLEHFADKEHGGFFWSIAPGDAGPPALPVTVQDDHKNAYGHAFALLALCHVYGATGDRRFLDEALKVRELLVTRFRDGYGGMRWRLTRDWTDTDECRSQNPMMHTFEALLALADVCTPDTAEAPCSRLGSHCRASRRSPEDSLPDSSPLVDALEIAGFLFEEKQNVIPEFYDLDWRPLPHAEGGHLSIGHHFEWAFLLSRGVELGLPDSLLTPAQACLDTALAIGCRAAAGSVQSYADEKGNILSDNLSWWEHAEALRALMHWCIARGETKYLEPFGRTLAFVKARFVDPEHGGWFKSLKADGSPLDTAKGSAWKLDYHQVALCREASFLDAD